MPSLWPIIWAGIVSTYRIVVNFFGYVVSLIDSYAKSLLDWITDGSGILVLLSQDVVLQREQSPPARRQQKKQQHQSGTDDTEGDTQPKQDETEKEEPQQNAGGTGDTAPKQDDTKPAQGDTGGRYVEVEQMTAEEITLLIFRKLRLECLPQSPTGETGGAKCLALAPRFTLR